MALARTHTTTRMLAGALGKALACRCIELGWVRRTAGSRAVTVTQVGHRGLRESFGLQLEVV